MTGAQRTWRRLQWHNEVLLIHISGGTEKTKKDSEKTSVTQVRFKPRTSRIWRGLRDLCSRLYSFRIPRSENEVTEMKSINSQNNQLKSRDCNAYCICFWFHFPFVSILGCSQRDAIPGPLQRDQADIGWINYTWNSVAAAWSGFHPT